MKNEVSFKDIVILFAFLSGTHYNLENLLVSFSKAKDKKYAIGCMLPYAQFFMMMFASSYSQLFTRYPVYFMILNGFFLTWVTAIFNLCSTAGAKFDWIFVEPMIFLSIVFVDHFLFIDEETAKFMYIGFFLKTMGRYVVLMRNIVNQITTHMGLHFLKVKDQIKND